MGFRKFNLFNKAFIANQAWRFLTNLGSLLAQLYKARYFKDSMEEI